MKKVIIFLILFLLIIFGSYMYFNRIGETNIDNNKSDKANSKDKKDIKIEITDVKNSIFKKNYDKAINSLEKMTIEEKIGQLFIVRYDSSKSLEFSNYYPGGYVLFAKDFEGKKYSFVGILPKEKGEYQVGEQGYADV